MKRRDFLKFTSAASVVTWVSPAGIFQSFTPSGGENIAGLKEGFLAPPDLARTHCFWFWMNGNISKSGITRDLEAIKAAGVGGVMNFDAGTGMIKGPVDFGSKEYWALKNHAISECNRLNLFFGMHNCPGWSSSGGPWVKPEHAMMDLTWSETSVTGGKNLTVALPKPFSKLNYYRDTFVLAYPALPGEAPLQNLVAGITSNNGLVQIEQLTTESQGVDVFPTGDGTSGYLQFEFKEPYQARSVSFSHAAIDTSKNPAVTKTGTSDPSGGALKLEVSDDGIQFREAANLGIIGSALNRFDFPVIKGRYFRLSSSQPHHYSMVRFSGAERISEWKTKANYISGGDNAAPTANIQAESIIDPNSIVNLSHLMDKDGNLRWDAPAGDWVILRLGYAAKGTFNNAAPEGGEGLEIDKYSKEAMDLHFTAMMSELLPTMAPLAAKSKVFLEIDSWEVGIQNWTPGFREEFLQHAGYDLTNYLPAMTGRVVGSAKISDRFLWDLRRTQADLVADNYYGHFDKLCKKHGFSSINEPYENGPFEELQISSRVDYSIGEFWSGLSTWFQHNYAHRRTTKLCASVAHVYGKKIVGAEAFTAEAPSGKWQEYPFALKALGDKYFTEGLTRIIFHRYAMQPNPDPSVAPGMTMAYWGMHFERTNTWWGQSRKWLDYLARCQYMLQQGLFVADLVYFTGEGAPKHTRVFREDLNPVPPEGFDYDVIDREVILTRMQVKNGRIVLPDGMSYRIMVVQEYETMTLELVRKLHELVKAGMILVGAKPKRTPGLGNRSGNDKAMLKLADELWGDVDGKSVKERGFGKGRVFWGETMETILDKLKIAHDFEVTSRSGDAPIRYIHRTIGDTEAYFICNERRDNEDLVCTFRVNNRQPEFWDADSGAMIPVGIYETSNGRVRVPVQLKPYGSLFVVFRSPATDKHLHQLKLNDQTILGTSSFPQSLQTRHDTVTNNFTICVWAKPEIDIMIRINPKQIYRRWTDYYTIYPPSGNELYGEGHETSGLAVGRNGVAIWHRQKKHPFLKMLVPTALESWTHVAVVYHNGIPSLFLNGKPVEGQLIKDAANLPGTVHPGVGKAFLRDGASYYNGDMGKPQLFAEALDEERIRQLARRNPDLPEINEVPLFAESTGGDAPGLLFWQNGNYSLIDNKGKTSTLEVAGISEPVALSGPWDVSFPPNWGAPEHVVLPELASLHKHEIPGVKYFSGTAAYNKKFTISAGTSGEGKRLFLDLGRVAVVAEVHLNGKNLGTLWTRPYRTEITGAVIKGENDLTVKVVNLWPNRLIGDEQLPPEYAFEEPVGDHGASIKKMPKWYLDGEPKPKGERVTFCTWQHFQKNDPLLESGLIGPVTIRGAIYKKNHLTAD